MCNAPSLKISLREKLEAAIDPDKIRVVEEMDRIDPPPPAQR